MRRTAVCLTALMLLGVVNAEAQHCRRYVGGHVVVCDRDRDHERRRHGWDRGPVEFGVRGGYDFEDDQGSAGAQIRVPVIRQFAVAPSFDVYLGDEGANWQFNADGIIKPDMLGGVYVGGGAAVLRREFDVLEGEETKVGWNALAGIDAGRIGGSSLRPFAEARWTGVGDDFTAFRLVAGFNVPISGWGR